MAETLITDQRSQGASYTILRRLGKGGMAEVFLARQEGLAGFRRLTVIKKLLPQFSQVPEVAEMLLDEARIAAQLTHPSIVQIFELGKDQGQYFIAMEYVDGCDLATLARIERHRQSRVPLRLALRVVSEAAMGLDFAHRQTGLDGRPLNVVHRDVSPHNLMCSREGAVKVTDFGIAKAVGKALVTQVGVVKGKVQYMSPEQYTGGPLDRRSDIFSLGVVLYQLTTGKLPRVAKDGSVAMRRVVEGNIPRPSELRSDYPDDLEAIVMRALAQNPQERYPDAASLREDLLDFARDNDLLAFPKELGDYVNELVPPVPLVVREQSMIAEEPVNRRRPSSGARQLERGDLPSVIVEGEEASTGAPHGTEVAPRGGGRDSAVASGVHSSLGGYDPGVDDSLVRDTDLGGIPSEQLTPVGAEQSGWYGSAAEEDTGPPPHTLEVNLPPRAASTPREPGAGRHAPPADMNDEFASHDRMWDSRHPTRQGRRGRDEGARSRSKRKRHREDERHSVRHSPASERRSGWSDEGGSWPSGVVSGVSEGPSDDVGTSRDGRRRRGRDSRRKAVDYELVGRDGEHLHGTISPAAPDSFAEPRGAAPVHLGPEPEESERPSTSPSVTQAVRARRIKMSVWVSIGAVVVALACLAAVAYVLTRKPAKPVAARVRPDSAATGGAGVINVLAKPPSAVVAVDGARRCPSTPCQIAGLPLNRELVLTVKAEGHELWMQRLVLTQYEPRLLLRADLTPLGQSTDDGAHRAGKGHHAGSGSSSGAKRGAKAGATTAHHGRSPQHKAGAKAGGAKAGGRGQLVVSKVEGKAAFLAVDVRPWAEVWVDGQKVGHTPIQVPLKPGRHKVELRNPDMQFSKTYRRRFKRGTKVKISVAISPPAGAQAPPPGPQGRPMAR